MKTTDIHVRARHKCAAYTCILLTYPCTTVSSDGAGITLYLLCSFILGHISDVIAIRKQSGNEFEPFANIIAQWYEAGPNYSSHVQ